MLIERSKLALGLGVLILVLLPVTAQANAGTALMLAGFLHMVFGNLFLGFAEGMALTLIWKTPPIRSVVLAVAANYLSAFVGAHFLRKLSLQYLDVHLYNAVSVMEGLVITAFLMTLILEWPFAAFCLRKEKEWVKKSIRATLIIQSISYLLLFGWYWNASQKNLYTDMQVVPIQQISTLEKARVYFISTQDGHVYSAGLKGDDLRKEFEVSLPAKDSFLLAEAASSNTWNLLLGKREMEATYFVIATNLPGKGLQLDEDKKKQLTSFGIMDFPSFVTNQQWNVEIGFWADPGLLARDAVNKRTVQVVMETPFVSWSVRNATYLPNDQVVFQLGKDQICLVDLNTRQVGLITRGRGPTVMIQE